VRQADTMPIVPGMSPFSVALVFVAFTPASGSLEGVPPYALMVSVSV
jgi:hypothetical protein